MGRPLQFTSLQGQAELHSSTLSHKTRGKKVITREAKMYPVSIPTLVSPVFLPLRNNTGLQCSSHNLRKENTDMGCFNRKETPALPLISKVASSTWGKEPNTHSGSLPQWKTKADHTSTVNVGYYCFKCADIADEILSKLHYL